FFILFFLCIRRTPRYTLFPYTTLFRSGIHIPADLPKCGFKVGDEQQSWKKGELLIFCDAKRHEAWNLSKKDRYIFLFDIMRDERSEEHTSELQSRENLVCRLLLEKKKK